MDRRSLLKLASTGALVPGAERLCRRSAWARKIGVTGQPHSSEKFKKLLLVLAFDRRNKPQPIWNAILSAKPDVFIFGGDNAYASSQPWQLSN
jgi:hypothetical protein